MLESIDLHLQRLRQNGDAPLKPCPYISSEFIPIPPHRVGIAHLVLKPRFLLADPTGCGKTPQALAAYGFLKQRDEKLRVLVMAERSAIFQWHSSVQRFLVDIQPAIVGYNTDSGSSVGRRARYATYENDTSDVFILSYHQMTRDIDPILANIDNYVVIFDEVQMLKSKDGQAMYPAALKLSMKGRYCWGLSATPSMNGRLDELYSIFEVIRPGTFGSYEGFKNRHFNYQLETIFTRNGPKRFNILNREKPYKNLHEVMKVVRPFYLKRPAELINKALPKLVTKDVMLEMLPDQAQLYDEIMEKRFRLPFSKGRINSLTALTYAQLASDSPECVGHEGDSSKMVYLRRHFSDEWNGEKTIIYARFRRSVDYITQELSKLGIKHVRITGKEGTKQREDAKLIFNDPSSGVDVICINKAGGTSLDLQQASIVIFYDLPWSWGEWTQVLGRARRIGSPHEKVLVILLVNQGTIDQYALKILRRKESLVGQTIGIDEETLTVSLETLSELYEMVRKKAA